MVQQQLFNEETPEMKHIRSYNILHEYFFNKFDRIMLQVEFQEAIDVFTLFFKTLNEIKTPNENY